MESVVDHKEQQEEDIKFLHETLKKVEGAYAPATIRGYREDFERFIAYCTSESLVPLEATPETLCRFIRHLTEKQASSAYIRRIIAAVAAIHRLNRLADPTKDPEVKIEMMRMHRLVGRHSQQAAGITADHLMSMAAQTDSSLRGYRDRAMLFVGYEGLLRRSELISLRAEDIVIENESRLRIRLRRSKTDQCSAGRWLLFSPQASIALKAWIDHSGINTGFVFRGINRSGQLNESLSTEQVNRTYKKLARLAKVPVDIGYKISGHSLRVGAARDLLVSGADIAKIMAAGRWSKTDTVMRYVEQAQGAFLTAGIGNSTDISGRSKL